MNSDDHNQASADAIDQRIATLLMLGANRHDPVAYHLAESLARKARHSAAAVQRYLLTRTETILNVLEQRFESAREDASARVRAIEHRFPHAAEQAQQHFVACDFQALKQFHERLLQQEKPHPLATLTQSMLAQTLGEQEALEENTRTDSLDALLKKQEKELLEALGQSTTSAESTRPELKSMQLFRDTWAKVSTERRVTKVVEHAPRDTGPLNSQTLVVRSLTAMREISPDYANRFVSYIDTLLWLEKSGIRPETPADKGAVGKGAVSKGPAGKPASGRAPATARTKSPRKRAR